MAINRVLNAIWAEISARGSLIKTATNPYNPTPGGDVPGANNQGLAALQSPSPFILLNRDGVSSQVPVSSPLGSEDEKSPTPLDENSGAYHVVRQYGDIYLFNDGNVVAWGGNGKNFSFGNGYEENHAWAGLAAVYNSETFTIPAGAMSDPDCFASGGAPNPSPTANMGNQYEWLGGNVSKNWGVDYSYSYGTSYEWSAGPSTYIDAYGNTGKDLTDVKQGKHCTYSYGTGYEETLVAWDRGSGWFHADDSTSPYASRAHDDWHSTYLSIESVAASFATTPAPDLGLPFGVPGSAEDEAALDMVFNPQDFATRNTWKAENLLVSKTFGSTYDYHYGPGLSVTEGHSEERVYGNSYTTVQGDSSESVTGKSTSNVTGDSTEEVHGNSTSHVYGNDASYHWGLSNEYFMGGQSSMSLAACDEITLSAVVSIVGGGAVEIFLGAKMELVLAAALEIKGGTALNITAGPVVELNLAKVEVAQADVKTREASISTSIMKLFV